MREWQGSRQGKQDWHHDTSFTDVAQVDALWSEPNRAGPQGSQLRSATYLHRSLVGDSALDVLNTDVVAEDRPNVGLCHRIELCVEFA
jgi:hypothetical protein